MARGFVAQFASAQATKAPPNRHELKPRNLCIPTIGGLRLRLEELDCVVPTIHVVCGVKVNVSVSV